MVATNNQPVNDNFLSPTNASRFWVRKLPTVNFYCQESSIPGINLPVVPTSNPFVTIPKPGDHIEYNELPITFIVDEDLKNYLEIHNWIKALGNPDDFDEYAALAAVPAFTGLGLYSDAALLILDAKKNPRFSVMFQTAFPFDLSDATFDTRLTGVQYLTATAKFAYIKYDIESILDGDISTYEPPFDYPDRSVRRSLPGKNSLSGIA